MIGAVLGEFLISHLIHTDQERPGYGHRNDDFVCTATNLGARCTHRKGGRFHASQRLARRRLQCLCNAVLGNGLDGTQGCGQCLRVTWPRRHRPSPRDVALAANLDRVRGRTQAYRRLAFTPRSAIHVNGRVPGTDIHRHRPETCRQVYSNRFRCIGFEPHAAARYSVPGLRQADVVIDFRFQREGDGGLSTVAAVDGYICTARDRIDDKTRVSRVQGNQRQLLCDIGFGDYRAIPGAEALLRQGHFMRAFQQLDRCGRDANLLVTRKYFCAGGLGLDMYIGPAGHQLHIKILEKIQPGHFNDPGKRQESFGLDPHRVWPWFEFDWTKWRLADLSLVNGHHRINSRISQHQQPPGLLAHPQAHRH